MIRATVNFEERFGELGEKLERTAKHALNAAIETAGSVAEGASSIDLELELQPAEVSGLDRYSAGVKSRKRSRNPNRSTPIAGFYDGGTLGKRSKPPKRPRKSSWEVSASDRADAHTAHRGDIEGKGIEPEHFFAKARKAGRAKLLEQADRELT